MKRRVALWGLIGLTAIASAPFIAGPFLRRPRGAQRALVTDPKGDSFVFVDGYLVPARR